MKCNNCGAELQSTRACLQSSSDAAFRKSRIEEWRGSMVSLQTRPSTNFPFKVTETSIVIIKGLPVIQCGSCTEYLIEDSVFNRVEEILAGVDSSV